VIGAERSLACRERAAQECEGLSEVAACGTRLRELLERDHDDHVIRRESLLANRQRAAVQRFCGSVVAEPTPRDGVRSENGGDFRMVRALGSGRDVEQSLDERLGARKRRLTEKQLAQLIEHNGELRVARAAMALPSLERLGEESLGLSGLREFLLYFGEADERIDMLTMQRRIAARRLDCGAQSHNGSGAIVSSERQRRGLDLPRVKFNEIRHVTFEAVRRLHVLLAGHTMWIARLGNHLRKDDSGKGRKRPWRCPVVGTRLEDIQVFPQQAVTCALSARPQHQHATRG
jgi:hypothetical protein